MTLILFIVGFILLVKGAEYLVDGAASLAKKWGVSNLVIGLTIVAFGTSMPELVVNVFAALRGTTDIAIGNIVGSNIVNILFILGVSACIYPLKVGKGTVWKEIPLALLAGVLLLVLANDQIIDGQIVNILTRSEGLVLIAFFIIFLYYTFGIAKNENGSSETENPKVFTAWVSVGYIMLGLLGLVIGGKWIVDAAVTLARLLGISDALIGLTIVAVGTSLPELATSAMAAYKKQADIAVGNVVGSNIFNIFWILGISAFIKPLPFSAALNIDLWVMIGASGLLFGWMFLGRRHLLERWQGVAFIFLYLGYLAVIIGRG